MINNFRKENFFLSNFYPSILVYNGIAYSSSEAAYQAQKTLDNDERKRISKLGPKQAKEEGRKLTLREDWEDIKINEMYNICKAKFTQNPILARKLLKTRDQELVENNHWNDTFWGVCNGEGLNNLGKILMRIRKEIGFNNVLPEKSCATCQNLSCRVETKEKIGLDKNGNPKGAFCIGYINYSK